MVMPAPAKEELEKAQIHTCRHCGYKGTVVHLESVHVGGRGYVLAYYCDDSKACGERRSKNITALRKKWGFCPVCGLNPKHPTNAYSHRDGKCGR